MIPSELSSNISMPWSYLILHKSKFYILCNSNMKSRSYIFQKSHRKIWMTAELSMQSTYLVSISSMPSTAYTTRIWLNPVNNFSFASVRMQSLGNRECYRDSIRNSSGFLLDSCFCCSETRHRCSWQSKTPIPQFQPWAYGSACLESGGHYHTWFFSHICSAH